MIQEDSQGEFQKRQERPGLEKRPGEAVGGKHPGISKIHRRSLLGKLAGKSQESSELLS